jgi:hypothetical protein
MISKAPASGLSAKSRVPVGLENVPTTPAPSMQTQTVSTFPPINQEGCPVSSSTSGRVSGRVLNSANEPIAGARVLVMTNTEPARIVGCVVTRSTGYYSFEWLDEFIELVFIIDPPVGSVVSLGSTGDVLRLPQATPLDWKLGTADLAGVINLDGVAASELATACLRPMNLRDSQVGVKRCGNVTPRANGVRNFAIDTDGLNLADYQLQVSFRNRTTQVYDFVAIPAANRLAITLSLLSSKTPLQLAPCQVSSGNSGNLKGLVTAANGTTPVAGARVEVSDPELYPSAVYGCAITDAQGRYSIDTRSYAPFQLLSNLWNGFGGGADVGAPPAECTTQGQSGCLNEDRDYLVMVDPPTGSLSTVGSTGGVKRAGTGTDINWTLGTADVAGTLKLSGHDSQYPLIACIRDSSRNASVLIMARCGRVIERANGTRSFAIDTLGMAGNSTELFVEYRSRFNLLSDYVNFAANPLTVSYDFLPSQVQEYNGCGPRQKPNVIGRVTKNGVGVQTKVFTTSKYLYPPSTSFSFQRADSITTATDGTYKFCAQMPTPGMNVQALGAVATISSDSSNASVISPWIALSSTSCTALSPCTTDIALPQVAFVTRITNAAGTGRAPNSMIYLEKSNNGFWDIQGLYSSNDEGVIALGSQTEGSYRLRVSPTYCYGEEDCLSTNNGYVETFANFAVNETGAIALGNGFSGTALNSSIALKEANIRLVVRTPDNDLAWPYAGMGLVKETAECAMNQFTSDCRSYASPGENGNLFAGVSDGVWTLSIRDDSSSSSGSANLRITVVNQVVTAVEALTGTASLVNGVIQVRLPEMQLIFALQDDSGQPLKSNIQVNRLEFSSQTGCIGCTNYNWVSTRNLDGGRVGIDISSTAYLWIKSTPGRYWDETGSHFSNSVPTSKVFKVEFTGNILSKVSECTTFTLTSTDCSGSQEKSKVNGSYIFQSSAPKITAKVCGWPATDPTTCSVATDQVNVSIELGSAVFPGMRTSLFNYSVDNGSIKLNPKADGNFFVTLTPGWSSSGIPSMGNSSSFKPIRIQILVTEGGTKFWRCPEPQSTCVTTTPNIVELIPGGGIVNLGDLRFVESTQIGYVKTPGSNGTNVANSNINIQPEQGTPWPATSWANSDSNGRFALDLPQGTYTVTAREPYVNPLQLVAGSLRLKITQVGDLTTMQVWENGAWVTKQTLDLRLRNPNFSGTLLPPTGDSSRTFVANANLNFEKLDPISGMYQWANIYNSTNSSGQFRIGLDDGNWRIKFEPPYELRGEYTGITVLVVVSGGEVTSFNGAACGPCVTDVRLPLPSLRGLVKDFSGNPVVNANINARRIDMNYSPTNQWYSWTSTNSAGKYSFAIPSNGSTTMTRYEIRIDPPYMMLGSTSVSTLATTIKYFGAVTREGVDYICSIASENATTCLGDEKVYGTSQDLVMNSANVFGQVLFNDAGVPAWIEVQKKNELGDYQYSGNGVSVRSDGQFALRLEQGIYKLTARPQTVSNGEAPGLIYILVRSDLSYCADTTPPNNTCTTSPSADINLESANLRGTVKTESGDLITNIWLEPSKWNAEQNSWNWISGVNVDNQGRFALQLIDDGPSATKYQLSMRVPEWSSSSIASKKFTIWVNDFIPGGSTNDLCGARLLSDCNGPNIWAASSNHVFELGAGNVSGDLKDSEGNAVPNQYLQMEVLTGTDSWNWYNSSTSTNSLGRFAFELDPGTYRFRIEPPTELRSNHSPIRQEITVADDGTWCRGSGSLCVPDQDLNLQFGLSNVRAHLDMTGVSWAWSNVSRWKDELDDCPNEPSSSSSNGWQYWQCWEWMNIQSSPNAEGNFSMQLPAGIYNFDIEIQKTDGIRSRVKVLLKVNSDSFISEPISGVSGIETLSGTQSVVSGVLEIAPPPPTVKGVLREPTVSGQQGNAVSWSWIEVQQKVTNANGDSYWEWRDLGTGTGMNGNFGLNLEVPAAGSVNQYRLRFRADRGNLATFTVDVLVNDQGQHSIDSNSDGVPDSGSDWLSPLTILEVNFPIPNVTGVLTSDDEVTAVSSSWINAQRWISYGNDDNTGYWNWIDIWSSTDQNGRYSMVLPEGDYRLEVRPPWDSSDLAVFYAFVSVNSTGVATRCLSETVMPCSPTGSQDEIDLIFPAPTLVGELVRENGTTPVSDSWISVQKYDGTNWQWSNTGASTNRNGRFALLLETGKYRLEINPPWYLANLGRFAVYFNIADDPDNAGEKLWCDATLTSYRDCVPANSASALVQIQMRLPNVVGTVMDKDLPSQQSWVGISGADGYWNGTQTDANGTFRFILDDGTYTMYSHPNWSTSTSPYAVTEIVVTNGSVSSWKYLTPTVGTNECATVVAPAPCEIEIVLDRIPPNVSGTVRRGSATIEGAFVTVRKGSEVIARTITDSDGKYETYLPPLPPDESYDIRITIVEGQLVSSIVEPVTPSGSMQIQDFDFASVT